VVLFGVLQEMLPLGVSLKSPILTNPWEIYDRIEKSPLIRQVYLNKETFIRAIESFWFALESERFVLFFEQTPEGFGLRVHGFFFRNPFQDLKTLQEISMALFKASSVERIEVVLLDRASRGIQRLLKAIGFVYEGRLRRAFRALSGRLLDGEIFSMIREG